jgi:hypothetical protein
LAGCFAAADRKRFGGDFISDRTENMSVNPQLTELAAVIDSHPDWWRFPADGAVRGFFGTDPLFIVGDQPSTSSWGPSHPHRRAFYDLLTRLDAGNAHLTDLYKKRGPAGSLRNGLPDDFDDHLAFFRQELAILRPKQVVALGGDAHLLIATHVPEVAPILREMWHFGYAVRYGRMSAWEEITRRALSGTIGGPPVATKRHSEIKPATASVVGAGSRQSNSQRKIMQRLFVSHDRDIARTIAAYADAERSGEARRERNNSRLSAEQYARGLLKDGLRKGWLNQ